MQVVILHGKTQFLLVNLKHLGEIILRLKNIQNTKNYSSTLGSSHTKHFGIFFAVSYDA